MSRDYKVYLDDILEAVQKVKTYVQSITHDQFLRDSMRIDAIVRNLEIIGEATSHIPAEVRAKYPEVEWQKASNFRNIAIHEYFRVSLDVVWNITQDDLSKLETQIADVLKQEDASSKPPSS